MRAVVYERFAELPTVREVPDPQPAPDGVVLRVDATGLCRSDWHGWLGHDSDITLPQIPGHEIAGTIAAVGNRVTGWRVGARVTVPFVCACGRCAQCRAGQEQVCGDQRQPGFTDPGSFADYVAIPRADVNLVALPDGFGAVAGAVLGCRYGTAFRAVSAQARIRPGEAVAVHGCGGLGLATVMIAAAAGARVIAVDVDVDALDLATALGAAVAVRGDANPVAAIVEDTGGGAAVSFDCLGAEQTAVNSLLCLARRGRHVQVGLLAGRPRIPMDRVIAYELQILGSHGIAAHEYPRLFAQLEAMRLDPARLVRRVVGLAEAPVALAAMSGPPATPGITVIRP